MEQLLFHLIGDYITQSNWMACEKIYKSSVAFLHATIYSLPFVFIGSWKAYLVILISHFFVDRFRLAKYLIFAKNHICPRPFPKWDDCQVTGYPSTNPSWMSVWLLIIADNTVHLTCNYLALRFL